MNPKPTSTSLIAATCLLFLSQAACAHHVGFCRAIITAVEKADIASVKALFEDAAWEATEGGISAAALLDRLKRGKLVSLRTSSGQRDAPDQKFLEYSSYDKFDARLRCVLTFRISYGDETEQVFVLAKRIGDDGFSNPKAWRVWRIVGDRSKAEYFLGRKIPRHK